MTGEIQFPGIYVEELSSARAISGASTSVTAFVGSARRGRVNHAARIQSFADFEQRFGGLAPAGETGYSVRQFFENGGTEAWVVRIAQRPTVTQFARGLQALNKVETFNLLVLSGEANPAHIAVAADYCQQRRAFLIVDAPADAKTPEQMRQALARFTFTPKSHAAIYFPWVRIADPLKSGAPRTAPPGGTIAGLMARIDATRGVWKSPAGTEAHLRRVLGLEYSLNDREQDSLNPLGVNCLRSMPGAGVVAWGARTLAGADALASDYKYIPVRRLALFIEASLERGTRWSTFEPNEEPLWAQLRLHIGTFLQQLFRQGAFQGRTARDAYFVKCDSETTTQTDVANGAVNVVVGFAPLKPAEFTILKLQLMAARPAA